MNITDKENELFNEWKQNHPKFSFDGIVSPQHYLKSKIKTLFILKEVNSKEEVFDLRKFIVNDAPDRGYTWNNISLWKKGIENINHDLKWQDVFVNIKEQCKVYLPQIGVVNIKKHPGGHTAINSELKEHLKKDSSFFNKQLQLYFDSEFCPELIIACGSYTSSIAVQYMNLNEKPKWEKTSRGIEFFEFQTGKYYIEYSHPEARVSNNLLYYGLVDAVREIFQK